MKTTLSILFALLTAPLIGQATRAWVTVASENATISIPAGTTLRYGAPAGTAYGCGTGPALATAAWVTPTKTATVVTTSALGVSDPAPCYVKVLQVEETTAVQTVTVNGKSVPVPALATPPAPKTYTVTCTAPNIPSPPVSGTTYPATCVIQ